MTLRHTLIVNASHDRRSGKTGIGIAIHETDLPGRNGPVIDRISECYMGIPAGQADMFAVCHALEISRDRGFNILKIRSQNNGMRTNLKECHEGKKTYDDVGLKGYVLRLAKCFELVYFRYKPRRKNQMAHELARKAVKEGEPMERPPI